MSRRTVNNRLPTHNTPAPVLIAPSGPSSGRSTPSAMHRPSSTASQYSESPYGMGMGSGANGYSRQAHDLEGQNDDRLEGLMGKVKMLKDITVGIGNEVRDSNMELGNMNDAFASTSTFLGGTFTRMKVMAKRQGGNWCWFMMFLLLVLWIFVVLWWFRR